MSLPGIELPGLGVDHPPAFSAEVKERVELCLYYPSGLSWPVLGRNLCHINYDIIWYPILIHLFCLYYTQFCGFLNTRLKDKRQEIRLRNPAELILNSLTDVFSTLLQTESVCLTTQIMADIWGGLQESEKKKTLTTSIHP
jgi:hypothetical protein